MTEPVKYMDLLSRMLQLYQGELLHLFKKFNSLSYVQEFKEKFDHELTSLKKMEIDKSITQNPLSTLCQPMNNYLYTTLRPKQTSQSERQGLRANLKSQDTTRMRFTGGVKKNPPEEKISELDQIVSSFKIKEDFEPKMRMKWKSFAQSQNKQEHKSTIGNNNIELLSYTIPEMENSIKRLSLQGKNKSPQRYDFDAYRTVDTRSHQRKKYVPRLF